MPNKGWKREPARHSLAAMGVKTNEARKFGYKHRATKNFEIDSDPQFDALLNNFEKVWKETKMKTLLDRQWELSAEEDEISDEAQAAGKDPDPVVDKFLEKHSNEEDKFIDAAFKVFGADHKLWDYLQDNYGIDLGSSVEFLSKHSKKAAEYSRKYLEWSGPGFGSNEGLIGQIAWFTGEHE
jgi:hypothetical protein